LSRISRPTESAREARNEAAWRRVACARVGLYGICRQGGLLLLLTLCGVNLCQAEAAMQAGPRVGLLFAVTHLHPLAYFILFLIVMLSVANLFVQGWLSRESWPLNRIFSVLSRSERAPLGKPLTKGSARASRDSSLQVIRGGPDALGGVVGVPRPVKAQEYRGNVHPPTPLDGLNHPIPRLSNRSSTQTGAPRIVERSAEKKSLIKDFKFSATVDLPSPEELERREKEQLVVSGSVTGPDGRGIPSAIVYLTDEDGNRIGQSCRTQAETGEFKVLVNEPGKYLVNVYKRGHVLESSEAMALPIESGKIEGYRVRMIPEGCIVQGRVTTQGGSRVVPDVHVKCLCKAGDYSSRSARTDNEGRFRLSGIPINSECWLEVLRTDGKVMVRSNAFETVQRREIHQDLIVAVDALDPQLDPPDCDKEDVGWNENEPAQSKRTADATPVGA